MRDNIPVFRPSITQAEIDAVTAVLKSGWLGLGPETAAFEVEFGDYVKSAFAVGLNSGTAALHLAMELLNLKPGDEVIVPTITFVSTAHAVEYAGATPVFADVLPDTLCIDPGDVEKRITPRTKAVIPVHYGGHPCEMDQLAELARQNNLTLVEDAAHACGACYRDAVVGSLSPLTCFSFHAVKNLCCGEGGMLTGMDPAHEEILRRKRWLGISRDTYTRDKGSKVYDWEYYVYDLGYKAHLSDVAASMGRVQLRRLPENNERRRRIVETYNDFFSSLSWATLPVEKDHVKSSWHIYHLKLEKRDELITHLRKKGVAAGVHYYPNHLHPYYKGRNFSCPTAEQVWKRIITLPLYPDMTDDQVSRVIDAVSSFHGE